MDELKESVQPGDELDEQLVDDQLESDLEEEPNKKKKKRDLLLIAIGVLLFLFIFLSLWTTPQQTKETASSSTPAPRVASNVTPVPSTTPSGSPAASGAPASAGASGTSGGGFSAGGSGSSSGGSGSNSSTSLTTHNSYNYYTTSSTEPTPTPGSTPTPTPTANPTPTPTVNPTPTANPTPTPPNPTPTPTANPTPTPTNNPTPTPTNNPTPTPTPAHTPTPTVLGASTGGAYGLLTNRNATLSSSRVSGTTSVALSWKTGTTATVKGIRVLACTTPNDSTSCVVPTGASFSSSSLSSVGGQLTPTWSYTINGPGDVILTKAAGNLLTAGVTETVNLSGFVNPTAYGTFFLRVITYSTTTAANVDSVDFGGIAVSTAKSLTVSVDVQEEMIFRVANSISTCDGVGETDIADPNDPASDIVTLSPNPITTSAVSSGTAQFCAVTNAQNGYIITYADWGTNSYDNHAGFWNGAHEFNAGGITSFASTPGTEQFGFNVADTAPTGGAGWTLATNYNTTSAYSYNDSGTPVQLVSTVNPATTNIYTMTFKANVSAVTPGGTYRAHQMLVCTSTF